MPTKQKTCGAERAGRVAADYLIRSGLAQHDSKAWLESALTEIFSRETHDAEMLEELKYMVRFYKSADHDRMAAGHNENCLCPICRAEALIAKVEK